MTASPGTSFALPEIAALNPDTWTAPFWEAALEHRLVAPRCTACNAFRLPPAPFCWRCRKQEAEWVELTGEGTVYTFTITRRALIPQLEGCIPYVVVVVDLDGAPGARLIGNLLGSDPDTVHIGMRVRVQWDDVTDDTTIPRFVANGET